MSKNFKILSLSGGGFLGLYTIKIIEEIEENLLGGKPIAKSFDLIAGTSVGGIIALALAAEVPASEIRKAFEENGEDIFSNEPKSRGIKKLLDISSSAFSAKYESTALREIIESLIGSKNISDLKHDVMVSTFNMTKGEAQFFKKYQKSDSNLKVLDVAMATSAAPIYFPAVEINNELFVDGGLYLNAPDIAALHDAEFSFGFKDDEIQILSIGTLTAQFSIPREINKDMGLSKWLSDERLIRAIVSSQQTFSDSILKTKLEGRYLRIDCKSLSKREVDILGIDVATKEARDVISNIAKNSYQKYEKQIRELVS